MVRPPADTALRLGISRCLLGDEVRYDSGHKRDDFLTQTVGPLVEWVPVCPEVEVGMGIPREAVRLVDAGKDVGPRMVARGSGDDWTDAMNRWARDRVRELADEDLDGFILKRASPSCGMERVRIYGAKGQSVRRGPGLFAAELLGRDPLLPVEEEGRLNDPRLRENFLVRVFAYRRLRETFGPRWKVGDLVCFHTTEKLLLMAHDLTAYRALGRTVADAGGTPRAELAETYSATYMAALRRIATRRKHVHVMQHMQGPLKTLLDAEEKAELGGLIEDFRQGLVPLVVPLTLFRHHARRHDIAYLQGQAYLEPAPKELMLRNHV